MNVVECEGCGGALVFDAQHEAVRCPFCAGVSLRASDLADVEIPTEAVSRKIDDGRARALFRTWARRSWWTPKALRDFDVELQALWVPVWSVEAWVEATWTGLAKASTRSGKRPRSGTLRNTARQWIPASMGLSLDELRALAPASDSPRVPWSEEGKTFEVGGLSGRGAIAQARPLFVEGARMAVVREARVREPRVSVVLHEPDALCLMLPVYIGCFRFRDRPWRFVINAHTGAVCGRAPLDRTKVALAVTLVVVLAAVVLAWKYFTLG